MSVPWNFADIYEAIAAAIPDVQCVVQGERVVTWGALDRRANALAADLLAAGLGRQAKVAAYLYNGPEYLEVYVAAFKAGLAPVNTNYRYGTEEIRYLLDNADAEAVVFHASFADLVDDVRHQLPGVRRWYVVADNPGGDVSHVDWATPYESIVGPEAERVEAPWGRSGDDLLLLYTGGTTGMPKGVMWRQDDLFHVLGSGGNVLLGIPPVGALEELAARVRSGGAGPIMVVACPLMHGTGQFSALVVMNLGGSVVVLDDRRFDAAALWRTIERRRANSVVIVGDAFARPMLAELDAHPGDYDLSSVAVISSSGVMWSREVKEGLLVHLPHAVLFDSFGSSEAVGMGGSVSTTGDTTATAAFLLGDDVAVFTEAGERVAPGSGEAGMVARGGYLPAGYYKDEAKSAATFRTVEGRRWSIPGDWAEVEVDGTLRLLGRGSVCINTGGEKVYPEEVEEVLKRHSSVRDAVCVAVPDERFGEVICAMVERQDAAVDLDPAAVIAHVKGSGLAPFKAPKHVLAVDSIGRSPAGKVDYKALKAQAADRVTSAP